MKTIHLKNITKDQKKLKRELKLLIQLCKYIFGKFKKELNKGVARADEKKVVDHIKGVARSLNDKDMGLGAFNAYVQDVRGGRHMNSLSRKELNKLMDEFLENQRQRPDYFDVINITDKNYETAQDYSQMDRSFNFGLKRSF